MSLNFSFDDFNAIANGKYNAGQIDYVQNSKGTKLVRVNNHVFKTGKNQVEIDKNHVLEIKNAFLNCLTEVNEEVRQEIATELGMGDIDMTKGDVDVERAMQRRFEPLKRQQLREIIDKYVLRPDTVPEKSKSILKRRNAVNTKLNAKTYAMDENLSDVVDILTMSKSLDVVLKRRLPKGDDASQGYSRQALTNNFAKHISTLFKTAVTLLPSNAPASKVVTIFGQNVELTCHRGGDGQEPSFSFKAGDRDAAPFTVNMGMSMDAMVRFLQAEVIKNKSKAFTAEISGALLDTLYSKDIMGGIRATDRTSDTRMFAAQIISSKMKENPVDAIMKGSIRTNLLVMIAKDLLEQDNVQWNLAALEERHQELKRTIGGLDDETLAMLAVVAHLPLENEDGSAVTLVVNSTDLEGVEGPQEGFNNPFTNNIGDVTNRVLPDSLIQHLNSGASANKPEDIRDFVADLMFSDETLMSEVNLDMPGEHFRHYVLSKRNMDAFRAIMLDRSVLDRAVAPTLAPAARQCFDAMAAIIEAEYQKKYGVSLAEDSNSQDFKLKFANLINEIDGNTLSQCDNFILQFANVGTDNIQAFINDVFKLEEEVNVNQLDDETISRPYEGKSPAEIKEIIRNKSLNDLLDSSSRDTVPGQVGLFKVGLRNYFKSMSINDKRSLLAASLRYADTYDFSDVQQDHQNSVKQSKTSKFCGAILKGTGPILQKMMQGLPRTIMGGFADALEDMKSNLPPINRKIVQAHFADIIRKNEDIKSIKLIKSLGAATVGEALLCEVKYQEGEEIKTKEVVIKVMRHDAVARTKREAKIFDAAAKKLGVGMEKTWKGQYAKILEELDFTNEARNVNLGDRAYNKHPEHGYVPDYPDTPWPKSMKLFDKIAPQRNVVALERAQGTCLDKEIKRLRAEMNTALATVFESDPVTGRVKWNKGNPVLRPGVSIFQCMNICTYTQFLAEQMLNCQQSIMATSAMWFEEAIIGDGMYHGDMHAGNLMYEVGKVTIIDFGNVTKLGTRKDGVNERSCLLKMILGSMLRMPNVFLKGFTPLLSANGKVEYEQNTAKVQAILGEIMEKGQFSYDMCYRLQAAVNELQKLGLEMPPQINGFIQSMTRLQNGLAETNTLIVQYRKALKNIFGGQLLKPEGTLKRHEYDVLGEMLDNVFVEEQRILSIEAEDTDESTFYLPRYYEPIDDFANGRGAVDVYRARLKDYFLSTGDIESAKNAARELLRVYRAHLPEIVPENDARLTELVQKLDRHLNEIDNNFKLKTVNLKNIVNHCADAVVTYAQTLCHALECSVKSFYSNKQDQPGTFANVLATLMFGSGEAADNIIDQLMDDKIAVAAKIYMDLTKELDFKINFFEYLSKKEQAVVGPFSEAVKKDLKTGEGDKSYKVKYEF